MLGTRQVLACFFSKKEEISRTREERKGEEASSPVPRVPLARAVLAELSRQGSAAEHYGYENLAISACELEILVWDKPPKPHGNACCAG